MSNILAMLILVARMIYCMARPRCILFWLALIWSELDIYFLTVHTDPTQLIIDGVCLFAFIGFMAIAFIDELSRVRAAKS